MHPARLLWSNGRRRERQEQRRRKSAANRRARSTQGDGLRLRHHRRGRPRAFLPEDRRRHHHSGQRTRPLHGFAKEQGMNALPPGPNGSLIMGVMREFNRDTLGFITRCQRDYGDVVRSRFLYVTAYFIYNPADIESLLTTNAKSFRKAQSLRSPFFHRLVGNGLVTSEGDFWRRQRRLAQPAFHRQRISSYGDIMVQYANRAIDKWQHDEQRNLAKDMTRLTLEIVVKTLFNSDVSKDADHIGAM